MNTLHDLTTRSDAIKDRLDAILVELRNAEDAPARAIELAEEIALLLREATIIAHNIRYHNQVTEHLLNEKCSGPH